MARASCCGVREQFASSSACCGATGEKYGGSTSLLGFGWWIGETTQVENVYYVFSFCKEIRQEDLNEIVGKIKTWLQNEEAIAIEINGKMYLLPKEEKINTIIID